MYTIVIESIKGVFVAELRFKFPFDAKYTVKDIQRHVDQEILNEKIKNWYVIQRKYAIKYQ